MFSKDLPAGPTVGQPDVIIFSGSELDMLPADFAVAKSLEEAKQLACDPKYGAVIYMLDRREWDSVLAPLTSFVDTGGFLPIGDKFSSDGFQLNPAKERSAERTVLRWLEGHSLFLDSDQEGFSKGECLASAVAVADLCQRLFDSVQELARGETKLSRFSTFPQSFGEHIDEATMVGSLALRKFNIALTTAEGVRILVESPSIMFVKGQRDLSRAYDPLENPAQEHLSPHAKHFPGMEELFKGNRLFFQTSATILPRRGQHSVQNSICR